MSDLIRKAQDVMEEAAVEIERLDAENAKLRADALASEPIVKAQAGEIYRLRARLAASDAACAQMREALEALRDNPKCDLVLDCSAECMGCKAYNAACVKVDHALATDAGRGYVSTEGAVEAEVMPMPLSNGNAALAAVIPADWIGHTVLIIRKPEDE